MSTGSRAWIDVGPCADESEATHAANLVSAYFEAEHARANRQRVWRSVAVLGLIVWVLSITTSTLTRVDLGFGVGLLACAVAASSAREWRARKRLGALRRDLSRSRAARRDDDETAIPGPV